jgi:hypothetical protein
MSKQSLNERIDRINYMAGYVVNESPQYRPIMDDSSFDSIPEEWRMKEADAPAQSPEPAPTSTPAPASGATATPPAAAAPATPPPAPEPPMPQPDVSMPEPMAPPMPEPAPVQANTDQLQNDVMRLQLDAMKKMTEKIEQLESLVTSLNSQQAQLHDEVEKVKDPSDVEKFNERKQDSSPYYFNLNDMWNGNTFQGRMDNFNSKGIVKTEDGYVADFDQLPRLSPYEVKNSFEQI